MSVKENFSRLKKLIIITILIMLSVPIIWIFLIRYDIYRHTLPKEVTAISQFIEIMPQPKSAFTFTYENRTFIGLVGNRSVFPSFPSGDPIYIFDDTGSLVHWTIDNLESNSIWLKVISTSETKYIPVKEIYKKNR